MPRLTTRLSPIEDSEENYENPHRQSSVLPYRLGDNGLEILMITSSRKKRWIIPKGIVEPDMTPAESAAKEALEEAGCEGEVVAEQIGHYAYRKWGGICQVEVYTMRVDTVHETWLEAGERDRAWVPANEAVDRIKPKELKNIVKKFVSARRDRS